MAVERGSKEYYDFHCNGDQDEILQMLASNYQSRLTIFEMDEREIWYYSGPGDPFGDVYAPQIIKAWRIQSEWTDESVEGITLIHVLKQILKNIGKKIILRRDDFDESILVAIIDKNYVEPQESDDWVEDWNPTPEEIEEIMEIRRQNEIARLTEAGFIDPETGDFTPDYYRESDFAYNCQREQR